MTNILLDAGNVLSLSLVGTVFSGSEQLVNTTTNGASFISGTDAETFTGIADLIYDDTLLQTEDGTSTFLRLSGIIVEQRAVSTTNSKLQDHFSLQAAGLGTIRGSSDLILEGSVVGTVKGKALASQSE